MDFTTIGDPARLAQVRAYLADGFTSGALTPRVDRIFAGLDSVVEAHAHAASGRQFGKVLISLGQ